MMRRPVWIFMVLSAGCFLEPDYTFTVSGTVVSGTTEAPIPDAQVQLRFREPFSSYSEYPFLLGETRSDAQGAFLIVIGAPPGYDRANCGTLSLRATHPGYAEVPIHGVAGLDPQGSDGCSDGEAAASPIVMAPLPE